MRKTSHSWQVSESITSLWESAHLPQGQYKNFRRTKQTVPCDSPIFLLPSNPEWFTVAWLLLLISPPPSGLTLASFPEERRPAVPPLPYSPDTFPPPSDTSPAPQEREGNTAAPGTTSTTRSPSKGRLKLGHFTGKGSACLYHADCINHIKTASRHSVRLSSSWATLAHCCPFPSIFFFFFSY